ncbi:DNA adenine methylase [Vallitalea guaymasensis]|uniref:DNA adenine methylase n=1 Tax=Vallitalea guaymasensis TaxID=1185412 RepID=UPI002353880E|nr:DNA adenine methylase [Vallitalea guaymasensis]
MRSFVSWMGGKNSLKKEIVKRFPTTEFNRYIEVFGGAGWVLFHSDRHAETEIYNDFNSNLVNLFKCVKYHCPEVERELKFFLNSRELFNEFKDSYNTAGMTDIQRAARFFMVIKTSYGSKLHSYGCVKKDIPTVVKYFEIVQERLSKVVIENRDFEHLIKTYNKPKSFFYLDPPYYGTEKYYQVQFSKEDHVRLKKALDQIKGKFLLSYNDCEYIRKLYKDYNIEEVKRPHNLHTKYKDKEQEYKELIITNY